MAKAKVKDVIFPDVTLTMSHEEALNLFKILSIVSLKSPVDTYPVYEALDEVIGDSFPPNRQSYLEVTTGSRVMEVKDPYA